MRKIFLFVLLVCFMLSCAVAQAAQVTDVKWGLSKENVLRLVIDVTESAGYAVNLDDGKLNLVVNAPSNSNIKNVQNVKGSVADKLIVTSKGNDTVVTLPLKKAISDKNYKIFSLKQDPKTGRPFRVVLDVTAGSGVVNSNSGTTGKPVVSNRPIVSNNPIKTKETVKPAISEKKETKKESKKETKKEPVVIKKADDEISKVNNKGSGLKGKVITLDPGHGGTDPGALGSGGAKEKDITLAISKYVQNLLEEKGAKVVMTRTTDVDVFGPYASDKEELQARVDVGEKAKADIFVSLHINSSVNKNIGGFSTYYYPKTDNDFKLAQKIHNKLSSNFGVDNLGVRQANFYVVKRISMPAVLLEMCFISNPKEEKLMQGKWFQKKAAQMIVDGIEEYFK